VIRSSAITSANRLNREFSLCLSPSPESPNIARQTRGVLLPRSVQFQRSLSPRSAQEARPRGRRGWTTEADAPPRDCGDASDSRNTFLALPPASGRSGDESLTQCSFFSSFSPLNADWAVVGCSFFRRESCRQSKRQRRPLRTNQPRQGRRRNSGPRPGLHSSAPRAIRGYTIIGLARILTDTLIRPPPDCAIDRARRIFGPWSYLRQSTYLTRKNWKRCEASTNSVPGIRWTTNVTVWFATRLSPESRSRSPATPRGTDRSCLTVPRSVATQYQLIGSSQPTKSWPISR